KPDQQGAALRTATGTPVGPDGGEQIDPEERDRAQQSAHLTTSTVHDCARPTIPSKPAAADRCCCRTTTCARRSPTSTMSGSPSGWCTPAVPPRTESSRATAPPNP